MLCCCQACTVTKKVKDGESAYLLKQYAVATEFLESEFNASSDRLIQGRKAYLLGKSYDILLQFDQALSWFEKAKTLRYEKMTLVLLGEAYKKNEQYTDAYNLYKQLYETERSAQYAREMEICKKAIETGDDLNDYNVSAYSINTKYAEYSPVYYGEDFLVFVSDRPTSTGKGSYNWTGNAFSDLYVSNIQGRAVNNFDAILNTEANEGTACFSLDLNEIFFTRCESIDLRDQHCRIYYSQKPNGF